jgi:hypothetical protein
MSHAHGLALGLVLLIWADTSPSQENSTPAVESSSPSQQFHTTTPSQAATVSPGGSAKENPSLGVIPHGAGAKDIGIAPAAEAYSWSISSSRPVGPVPAKILSPSFFLVNGLHLGMALFDVEMTQRCLSDHHCKEGNPLMPSSQAGQLGVSFAVFAYGSGMSYWMKKRHSRYWWTVPTAGIVAHTAGVATGFANR